MMVNFLNGVFRIQANVFKPSRHNTISINLPAPALATLPSTLKCNLINLLKENIAIATVVIWLRGAIQQLQAKWVDLKTRIALVSNVLQVFDKTSTVPGHLGNIGWNKVMATQACAASEVPLDQR